MAYTKDQLTALQKEASNYGGFTDQKFIDYVNQKGGAGSYDTLKTNIQGMQGQPAVTTAPKVQDPINTQTGTPVSVNVQPTIQPTQLNAPQTIVETPKVETPKVETPAKATPIAKTEQFDINKPSYQDTINEQVKQGNTETLKTKLNEGLQAGTLDKVQYNKMMNSVAQSETQQAKSLDNADTIFNFLNTGVTISDDLKQSSNYTIAKNRFDTNQMYSGLNSSQLGSLLSNGTLLPGTTAYNDLIANPEMKIKLDKINQLNLVKGKTTDINKVIETKSNEIANNTEVEIAGQKMTLKSALEDGFIDQNEFNAMTNTPQMTAKYQEVEDMRNEYDEQLATYKNIKTDIENRLKGTGATKTDIARAVAQAQEDLLPGLQATESRLNNAIGTLTQMKTDASQMFATNLGLYKESQARQQQLEDRTYNEQQAQKQLEQKFAYEYGDINSTDPNIQRVAIENAVAGMYETYPIVGMESQATKVQKVMDRIAQGMTGAEAIASVEQEIRNSPAYKDLMASQKASMTPTTKAESPDIKNLGTSDNPDWRQYDTATGTWKAINPKSITGTDLLSVEDGTIIPSRLSQTTNKNGGKECGEFVNDIVGTKLLGNSVEDKLKAMDNVDESKLYSSSASIVPGNIGDIAVWLPAPNNKEFQKYGHTGIIVGEQGDNWLIKSSNIKGDGAVSTDLVPKNVIAGTNSKYNVNALQNSANDFNATDTRVFNSLTASEKAKKQSDPKYINFVNKQNEVYNNPDATIDEILTYSAGGADLGETSIQQLSKFNQALSQVGELSKNITKETTGPIIGKLKSYNPYDSSAQALKAEINSLIPNIARGVYGEVGVLTDADIENYRKTLPNLTSTEATNKLVLAMTLKTMMNGYKGQLQTLAGSNKDVSKLQGKYKEYEQTINSLLQSIGSTGTTPTTTQNQSSVTGKSGTTYTLKPKQ